MRPRGGRPPRCGRHPAAHGGGGARRRRPKRRRDRRPSSYRRGMPREDGSPYPHVDAQPRFPRIELETIEWWETDDTFRKSVEARPAGAGGENEFVFYDGPP